MDNIKLSINLLKLNRSGVATIHGVHCVIIPIEDNDIYVSSNEQNKPKGAYLSVCAWESLNNKYGNTHIVKQSYSKEYRNKYPDAEKQSPILGNGKVLTYQSKQAPISAKIAENPNFDPFAGDTNDIPF